MNENRTRIIAKFWPPGRVLTAKFRNFTQRTKQLTSIRMALELTGKLIKVLPEVSGQSQKGPWNKQEFVVETIDQFPKKVCLTAWGEKANDLKQYAPGDTLKVTINLESREYNDRWYTEARAWRIEGGSAPARSDAGPGRSSGASAPASPAATPFGMTFEEESNDLPF